MTVQVTRSIIVKGMPADIYPFWADLEHIPQFTQTITSITSTGENINHCTMKNPLGDTLECDLEITRQEENKRIAWNSRDSGNIKTSGQITFNSLAHQQTEVTIVLNYLPPEDLRGQIAEFFRDLDAQVAEELRNFKMYAEQEYKQEAVVS